MLKAKNEIEDHDVFDDDSFPEDDLKEYDPLVEPDPMAWLGMDEQQRIDLVLEYHRRKGVDVPNGKVHAVFHAIVENQIAEGDQLPVRRTVQRLMSEGLDRHEALHAVGMVLAGHIG